MTKEALQLVTSGLDAIAAKLGVAAHHLWPVFIRQQMVWGIAYLIMSVAVCLLFLASLRRLPKSEEELNANPTEKTLAIIGAVVFGCALIIVFAEFADILGRLINPQYYAFRDLVKILKP